MGERWQRFFPSESLAELGESMVWAGQALERLGEPPLHPVASHQPLVARLLCLPTWAPVCSVLTEQVGLSWRVVGRELDGEEAGFELGELARHDDRLVGGVDAERVAELWAHLRFWTAAPTCNREVLDGTLYVLEAAECGLYRVVIRDDPEWGDTLEEFTNLLFQLAGLAPR